MVEVIAWTYRIQSESGLSYLSEGPCGHCKQMTQFTQPQNSLFSWEYRQRTGNPEVGIEEYEHTIVGGVCSNPACCGLTVVYRKYHYPAYDQHDAAPYVDYFERLWPPSGTRDDLPQEVPDDFRALYREAAQVESSSSTATAFLARMMIERLLKERLQKQGRLVDLIDLFGQDPGVPTSIVESLHLIRGFGNFAAHPTQSNGQGWLIVDAAEAAYLLDAIREIADFVFVAPARHKQMHERFKKKKRASKSRT